jgi:hypothetical protein
MSTWYINKMKDKNSMVISIDAEKAFDKIQYPFMIKKKNTEQIRHKSIKRHIIRQQLTLYGMWEKLNAFSLKPGVRQGCLHYNPFNIVLEVLLHRMVIINYVLYMSKERVLKVLPQRNYK